MTYTNLMIFVGASENDAAYVEQCWDEAVAHVNTYVGSYDVPSAILNRCYIEAGSELYHRRSAPMGVAQFATFDGNAVRVARDPLVGVKPILAPYVGFGGIG